MARRVSHGGRFRAQLERYAAAVGGFAHVDEMFGPDGKPSRASKRIVEALLARDSTPPTELQAGVERVIETLGITFTLAGSEQGMDRSWPLDVLPRAIDGEAWDATAAGLSQRLRAINMFIDDVYNGRRVLDDGIVPAELVLNSPNYLPQCRGARPAHGAWVNICGSDLIRGPHGGLVVLEDNLRVPSGMAYMLENRAVMYRVAAELFAACRVREIETFPEQLYRTLASLSPRPQDEPNVVVLTPGVFNSAYFEHVFLASAMGVELVEGRDLAVMDGIVYLHTVDGLIRVDVIYRRIDDTFLDPKALNPDSVIGVPGIFAAWQAGQVSIANAPGTGVADDKAIYSYVPALVRYYLEEEPLLGNLDTLFMSDKAQRDDAFSRPRELVFKPVNEAGGYGVVIGPLASKRLLEATRRRVLAKPANYIAQELCRLSTAPTLVRGAVEPCHVDLRPFSLQGDAAAVSAGGLTRVAGKPGQMVVNSSQGGGSKDTWIVDPPAGRGR